ncbi:siroheme synthase CysG [Mesorhizobium sp. SB112]|uniref:siroheme synthase CysG n=1 Tax=Mesorhizobium sp. SB112 TaxID=3151853 RepID=UPI003264434A
MQIISRQPSEAATPRIKPLGVLPVFFDLTGKKTIIANGTEAAAWKAELLAATAARLHVISPARALSDEMKTLIARDANIVHHDREWKPDCLSGAAVAICDAEDAAEAERFEAACRAAGAACNVIDKPAYCHFQFGSIVNRSPVIVGISTCGAAPILGQAVRRRIETLLPASLADWAALARDMRGAVINRLPAGFQRRAFWERFVDRAFGPAPNEKDRAALDNAMAAQPSNTGHVTFVGAGPGDAELLTLKAVRALQAADVILFDDLVSDEVLELARREAKRILVGKRAGRPSCKQHEINEMMVKLARAGRRVVRLKSGDPMIFGRAGEEIEVLQKEGIDFDVVPGISAGIAMAAALGVSLTHRDHAKSVRFVTGHSRKGGLPEDIDWNAIADPSATTIFYMGGRNAAEIANRLIARGLVASTPVAIAVSLGRKEQILRTTRLDRLAFEVAEIGVSMPLLIGVGEVFLKSSAAEAPSISRAV